MGASTFALTLECLGASLLLTSRIKGDILTLPINNLLEREILIRLPGISEHAALR